jgi:IS5 family transposase
MKQLTLGFNLSDPAVEEALYDSQAMRGFISIDLGREPVPDETTVCRFRTEPSIQDKRGPVTRYHRRPRKSLLRIHAPVLYSDVP